ncbi:glycoside hydrolase family 16 protein [Cereibacter sediminicola]|uniref:glycoside hydrolase family 16 protein n=1 Tax=Cereibacter sediminicola TaxID=2584941 RepID=UPI0011AAB08D|nr:glycoside hydrolase family 16 protein [Cereibacter sediminicola]
MSQRLPLARLAARTLLPLLVAAPAAADEPPASFRETFDEIDGQRWYISDGWTNGEHQNCTWSSNAIRAEDGILRLLYLPDTSGEGQHRCGEVQTEQRFLHGTFEARMRTDHRKSGLNAAFFTYIGPVHHQPHDEIDFEILTRNTASVDVNTYVSGEPKNRHVVPLDPPSDEGWHTFSFIWEPERLRWFVDGELVHEATETLPVAPQKIFFSHWSTDVLTEWMGAYEQPEGPVALEVDWVSWTAPGEACQFEESVLCRLED